MSQPAGFAILRTRLKDGHRTVVHQWTVDTAPPMRDGEDWRLSQFHDNEHFTYSLHRIEAEPVAEVIA